ncbi:hypothetical protein DEO72_LG10g2451 [Vigna unguiculata]|uniref:Uncharacterized protein n=1 Tax=Vigna unguiculata TaxID=3917 RepID=A0A4D6ND29_VIGUN|nr:hypothetical protein DEO72_LG10g2451 [Vigna unguiculata]
MCGKSCYGSYTVTPDGVLDTNNICNVLRLPKSCHSESQLKEYHVLNPYPEPQLKGYVLSHNSRNTNKLIFKVSPKPYRPRTLKQPTLSSPKLPGIAHESLGAMHFQIAWRATRTARCQAPLVPLCLQVSVGGMILTARHHAFQ